MVLYFTKRNRCTMNYILMCVWIDREFVCVFVCRWEEWELFFVFYVLFIRYWMNEYVPASHSQYQYKNKRNDMKDSFE